MEPLLTTMGILLANYDEGRDFLSNFEPFVKDRLCAWPADDPVKAKALSVALSETFSFPPIPLNTTSELIERARKDGYLRYGRDRKLFLDPQKLANVNGDLRGQVTDTLAHFAAVQEALREYAKETFDLQWSASQADHALEALVSEFGIEMAEARQRGDLKSGQTSTDKDALSVVHGFARHCLRNDAVNFGYLEELVHGSMLTNVLYFKDLGQWSPKIENLVVYLDTPIALRLLGLAPDELRLGAEEMRQMLQEMQVPLRVFEHTCSEIHGVLEGVRGNLDRARQETLDLGSLQHLNREVIEHLIREGWGPADVQEIMSDLEGQLNRAEIRIEPTPPVTRDLSLGDSRFEEILLDRRFTKSQAVNDIKSITAIYRLRKGTPAGSLAKARAIFVTPNIGLSQANSHFFREQGHASPVSHAITDKSFVTQLWLLSPTAQDRKVPRKLLIAECYAALDPPTAVWRRYLRKIDARRNAGDVTEEQVKTLIFSSTAQESFFELTRNDPNRVGDQTPQQVLQRYEETLRKPAETMARHTEEQLKAFHKENADLRRKATSGVEEITRQQDQLEIQRQRITELESWQQALESRRSKRRAVARGASGILGAILIIGAAVALLVSETITGSFGFAVAVFIAVLLALAVVGWALRKPHRWSKDILIGLGTILAFFFGVYEVAQGFFG